MSGPPGPSPHMLLRPVLDMYRGVPVAIVGCRSVGLARASCETDVLVVTSERRPAVTIKTGGGYTDILFVPEREVLTPSNPEHTVALSHARIVRDSSLILSTSLASNLAISGAAAGRSSARRLASALKSLGRVQDALGRGAHVDADYWLLSASYDFAYAWLYSGETSPSPSHLLTQLKGMSRRGQKGFEAFSAGAALSGASRANCRSRLDGLAVLYDVVGGGHERRPIGRQFWSASRLASITAKAGDLTERVELAECYAYLGTEVLNCLRELARLEVGEAKRAAGPAALSTGGERLLGDRLLRDLGLSRQKGELQSAAATVKSQVSSLARRPPPTG